MADLLRTFVAVEIPGEVQSRAGRLIERLNRTSAKVRWVRPNQLHWTLKFLGDVEMVRIPEICEQVAKAVAPLRPFDVEARGAGAFPDTSRPRTVWLGMGQGSEQMVELHAAVELSLSRLGYREDGRRFQPHVTIGRVRESPGIGELGQLIARDAAFDGGMACVYEVTVFSSDLGRDGPTYEPLAHLELGGV